MNPQSNDADYENVPLRERKKNRSRWPDRVALLFIAVLVCFVMWPAWFHSHHDNRTRGVVVDENKQPVPFATLPVHDAEGRDLGTATTDAKGEFVWQSLWGTQGTFTNTITTFGQYGATKYLHSTGGRDHVLISRLVKHKMRVKNAVSGLPQNGLSLKVIPEPQTFSVWRGGFMERETNQVGKADIGVFPVTVRMFLQSRDTKYVVSSTTPFVVTNCRTTPCQTTVIYNVTVVPTGSLSGRVVFPDKQSAAHGHVFARLISGFSNEQRDNYYVRSVNPDGTFRILGLMPGRYRLTYQVVVGYSKADLSIEKREFAIQSGQALVLSQPLRVLSLETTR